LFPRRVFLIIFSRLMELGDLGLSPGHLQAMHAYIERPIANKLLPTRAMHY
jgi:hypothetical protein